MLHGFVHSVLLKTLGSTVVINSTNLSTVWQVLGRGTKFTKCEHTNLSVHEDLQTSRLDRASQGHDQAAVNASEAMLQVSTLG